MSSPAGLDLQSTISPETDFLTLPSPDELAHRRDSDSDLTSLIDAAAAHAPAELPSPSSADSFNTASSSIQQNSSSQSSVTEPHSPALPSRRTSRRFPSLIARLSSAGVSPSRSLRQATPDDAHKLSRPSVDTGAGDRRPRENSDNRGSRSLGGRPQTLCNPNTVVPSHDSSTLPFSTTTGSNRRLSDVQYNRKDGKRRQLARTASTRSGFAYPKTVEPVQDGADIERKMHQTSSRLLRMTDDERPFTRVSVFLLFHGLSRTRILLGKSDWDARDSSLMVVTTSSKVKRWCAYVRHSTLCRKRVRFMPSFTSSAESCLLRPCQPNLMFPLVNPDLHRRKA